MLKKFAEMLLTNFLWEIKNSERNKSKFILLQLSILLSVAQNPLKTQINSKIEIDRGDLHSLDFTFVSSSDVIKIKRTQFRD